MKLVEPHKNLQKAYDVLVDECLQVSHGQHRDYEKFGHDFDGYLQKLDNDRRAIGEWPDMVPAITYWLMDDSETTVLAVSNLRLRLNKQLNSGHGGHIGYHVPPSQRLKGYGTLILKLTLEKAKEHGIDRVLVTCDVENTGSNKIIQKNGGVMESTVPIPETGNQGNRYWIEIV